MQQYLLDVILRVLFYIYHDFAPNMNKIRLTGWNTPKTMIELGERKD